MFNYDREEAMWEEHAFELWFNRRIDEVLIV